jgi:hypothetical protein
MQHNASTDHNLQIRLFTAGLKTSFITMGAIGWWMLPRPAVARFIVIFWTPTVLDTMMPLNFTCYASTDHNLQIRLFTAGVKTSFITMGDLPTRTAIDECVEEREETVLQASIPRPAPQKYVLAPFM